MQDPQELARERYRMLLRTFEADAAGERGGWQREAADALGISQAMVSKIAQGDREPALKAISEAIRRLHIDPDYFFDTALPDPVWRDFVRGAPRTERVPEFWAEFMEHYDRIDELDDEDFERRLRVMGFSGRRGIRLRGWRDLAQLADFILDRSPSERFESVEDE